MSRRPFRRRHGACWGRADGSTGVGRRGAAAAVLGAAALLAACGHSAASPPTTAVSPTTTTLSPAQHAELGSLLLTTADFPTGWTSDTQPGADSVNGTPTCVADLVLTRGSAYRTGAVFVGTGSPPTAVIQTVAAFPTGRATASVAALRGAFESCNDTTIGANGANARVSVRSIAGVGTGGAGFAAQMLLTDGKQSSYLDVFYAVKGIHSTFLGWSTNVPQTDLFAQLAAKALAKL